MCRATRIEFPGAFYHAMSRGIDRRKVFPGDEHFERFLKLMGDRVEGGDLDVHAFCLMENHFHLLLGTPRGNLSRWMQGVLGSYAQWYNAREGRSGHLWQGRYKAILVERGPYLLECSRYIHLNPGRAGLTGSPERWKWSSYRNYVSVLGRPAVPWVKVETVLGETGASGVNAREQRRTYRAYVESAGDGKQASPFERATAGLALGSESFVACVKDRLKGRPDTEDEPSLRKLRKEGLISPDRIEEAVEKEFGNPSIKSHARRILAALLVGCSGLRPAEVARRLGVTRGAVSRCIIRDGKPSPFETEIARKVRKLATGLGAPMR